MFNLQAGLLRPFLAMKTQVKFFLSAHCCHWLVLGKCPLCVCKSLDSYLLSAWLDVAASDRAAIDIQWLSSSTMATSAMSHQRGHRLIEFRFTVLLAAIVTPFISCPVSRAQPAGQLNYFTGFDHFTLLPPTTSTVLRGSHSLINRPRV